MSLYLVTNEWWEDLWLQEGLVTFLTLKLRSFVEGKNSTRYGDEYSDAESPTDMYQKRALVESIDDEGIVFDLLTYDKVCGCQCACHKSKSVHFQGV